MGLVCASSHPRLAILGLSLHAALVLPSAGQLQELEFCSRGGECEKLYLRDDLPARFCATADERPPWLAWPVTQLRFRVVLGAAESQDQGWWAAAPRSKPRLRYTAAPRGFCQWFGIAPAVLCPECSEAPCALPVQEPWGRRSTFNALLPPYGGCVYVQKLPSIAATARVSWEVCWDTLVPLWVVGGFVLVWYWVPLRENSTLHAAIGGAGSLVFVTAVVMLTLMREMRSTLQGAVPFGRGLTAFSMVLFTFLPAARHALVGLVVPDGGADWWAWLQFRDPFYDLPVGWFVAVAAALLAFAAVAFGANISVRYLASHPEVEGDVPFVIAPDGRRIDMLPPPPWPQRVLGLLLWALGVALLLFGTHSDLASLLLLGFAMLGGRLGYFLQQRLMSMSATNPSSLRRLISPKMFDEQGRQHTTAAIAQLQRHLQAHPGTLRSVREDSELRLRRFSDGGAHFQRPYERASEERTGRCSVL